mmetsp:Transcript_57381/g.136385  ORF Transcript_57381/g.136385 Transcript_57381/m.136385 type:complete len:278 (+) Transcript_57381:79-912(+)
MHPVLIFGHSPFPMKHADWQAVKENAWRNPLLVIAFLAAGGGFACIVYSSAFLIGGELTTVLLFHMAAKYEGAPEKDLVGTTWPSAATGADGNGGFRLDTDNLVLHPFKVISLVIFMSVPPAACTLIVVFHQLLGSMGKVRLDTFYPAVTRLALPWSVIWWLICMRTFFMWDTRECLQLERIHEPLCWDASRDRAAKVARHMCRSETGSECALVLFILGMYTLSSTVVLAGTGLCALGLWQARQDHDRKWARSESDSTFATTSRSSRRPHERQPLLA